jgi:predicted MPP superfamily phosphohydrolase
VDPDIFHIILVLVAAGLGGLVAYGWYIEPRWLQQQSLRVAVPGSRLSRPVHFLFISDLHIGRYSRRCGFPGHLLALRERQSTQAAEFILVAGDWMDREKVYLPALQETLASLTGWGIPVYGVLGNHDYAEGDVRRADVATALRQGGVTLLSNQAVRFGNDAAVLQVAGVEDLLIDSSYARLPVEHYREYAQRARSLRWHIKGWQDHLPTIVLSHNPDVVYLPLPKMPELFLAGHTHGGQFWPLSWLARWQPFWQRFHRMLPYGSFVTWAGIRQVGDGRPGDDLPAPGCRTGKATLVVSRGIGGASIPFRLFARPQAHWITLDPS